MTTKGKVILILLAIALIGAIFVPTDFIGIPVVLAKLFMFYVFSTALLFWIGAPAGWWFARDNGMSGFAIIIFAYIGMYLSLPIAIIQLIESRQ